MYVMPNQPSGVPIPESEPIRCDRMIDELDEMIDEVKYTRGLMHVADHRYEIMGSVETHLLNALVSIKHLHLLTKSPNGEGS